MALTATSLASAIDANTLDFNATSASGATVGGFARIDGEFSMIVAINGVKISVRSRGDMGTTSTAHDVLAPLVFGLLSDLASLPLMSTVGVPLDEENLAALGQNGAIPVPTRNTTYFITKATALGSSAMPNPSASQDGLEVQFVSTTDAAHVVTLVTSQDGTTGNHTTYTFPAFGGSSFRIKASKGRWLVIANNLVVIT